MEIGVSRRTLQYAREALGLRSLRASNDLETLTFWLKDGQQLPGEFRADPANDLIIAGVRLRDPFDPLGDSD